MDLLTARGIVKTAARNARDQTLYTSAMLDVAIQTVCNRDSHVLRYPKTTSTLTIQSGSNAVDLSTPVASGFAAHHFISMTIAPASGSQSAAIDNNGGSLTRIDYEDWWRRSQYTPGTNQPTLLAFEGLTNAYVWPTPDQDYTATLRWFAPFTSFVPGCQGAYSTSNTYSSGDAVSNGTNGGYVSLVSNNTNVALTNTASWRSLGTNTTIHDPAALTLSLPDDWLTQILATGVPARLQMNDPEHTKFAQVLQAEHDRIILDLRDAATLGGSLLERGMMK